MAQNITDYPAFFEAAKAALAERDELRQEEEGLRDQVAKLDKDLEAEKKQMTDAISLTVKKRMEEVSSTYDTEIEQGQDKLRKARARREKARNQGVKERIIQETQEQQSDNRELNRSMKAMFKKDKVPGWCNTNTYYSLFFPHRAMDYLKLLLVFIVLFAAIPSGVYFLIPNRKPVYLILIYIVTVLVFGGLYILIGNSTKLKHLEVLLQGKQIRDEIDANKRKIKAITNAILKDKNEDQYDLAEYDDDISHINQELADTTMKKKDALNTFDTVTKCIITDEITANAKPRIDALTAEYKEASDKLREVGSKRSAKVLEITDKYEMYLGKEFLHPDMIDELSDIMSHGTVTNISEAIEEYRNREEE